MDKEALLNRSAFSSSPGDMLSSTDITTKHPDVLGVYRVTEILNGLIIILGFITNSLILIILGRKKIGSQTTRIILIFLAVCDLIVMIIETFVHFIPYYTHWFPVFYTHIGCGIAFTVQASIITTSSWYIVLMTLERFTVVWFPMKARIFCTQKKILAACIALPILSFLSYCYLIADFELSAFDGTDYMWCGPKPYLQADNGKGFKAKMLAWIILYFYIPTFFIVALNLAIVIKLAQASKLHKLMRSKSKSSRMQQEDSGGKKQSIMRRLSRKFSRKDSQTANGIKKATTLVIAASVAFTIMMIPRGVSVTISLDITWNYKTPALDMLDTVTYLLQYLNHASNFFIYVLANNSFRKELQRMLCCSKQSRLRRPGELESTATNMTYVRKRSTPSIEYVSNPRTSNSLQDHRENEPLTEKYNLEDD